MWYGFGEFLAIVTTDKKARWAAIIFICVILIALGVGNFLDDQN